METEKQQVVGLENVKMFLTLSLPDPRTNPMCIKLTTMIAQQKARVEQLVS